MNLASISVVWVGLASVVAGQNPSVQAEQLESKGDAIAARQLLQRAARNALEDASALLNYAEFLDRYNDPETRTNYEKALARLSGPPNAEKRAAVARRLVLLDLVEGDRDAAAKHLEAYRAAGGKDFAAGIPASRPVRRDEMGTIEIPGPLLSFARMAAVSPEVTGEDLLPALARNVITSGYQASAGESLEPTEFMKLVVRYLSQARELEKLAGERQTIRIANCESAETGELLRILGYRMRGGCGSEVVLETVNATRAFLTIDSGFPLAQLEQALRTNRPFEHNYKPTRVAVLYGPDYWLPPKEKRSGDFIDTFLADPSLCRFYLGMVKLDPETAGALKQGVSVQRLKAFAHVLDFFGGMFEIRQGKAVVPGGARSAAAWADLAGASPDQGAAFFERLLSRDDGWMASYFDALARINGPVQDYLTEPNRMKRFYTAIRGRVTSPGPARPVFRSNADMMLLTTRLRLDPDGHPHVPGGIEAWKELFAKRPNGKWDSKLSRAASSWKEADDVLEALFALCRKSVENEALKIFMALSDVDRLRSKPLEAASVSRMAREYRSFGSQYAIFAEVPSVLDQTIMQYLDAAQAVSRTGNIQLRFDVAGTMQGLVGLWQIFCRQGSIPPAEADQALAGIVNGLGKVRNDRDLFDAGRSGVELLLKVSGAAAGAKPQQHIVDLLAGTANTSDSESHDRIVQDMVRIFEAQRLISLDTLFELVDNLDRIPAGEKLNTALVNRLGARISEIQSPRAGLSALEKNSLAFGYWSERHIDVERKLNIRGLIDRAGADAGKLHEIRGDLAPLLRDTLVGFNYMHYAPPGAQLLLANPVFVRNHDFAGTTGTLEVWRTTELTGSGWPTSAGGRLVGSLSGLPYALAQAEQNFLVPTREQALIWSDLVPQMILTATIPRWWNVTPAQMHWVGLHMRYAETAIAEAALDSDRRAAVAAVLERQASPARVREVNSLIERGEVRGALKSVTPAELFVIARQLLPKEKNSAEFPVRDIVRLQQQAPNRINYEAISRAFGTPKPTLTNSYQPELLYLRTFPTLMGFSSRIMAESWESTLLYWAALADEVHVSPTQLNVLIPEWTQQTVEKIFASHLEDWPALLRSLRGVGEDVRLKLRVQMEDQNASLQ